MTHISGKVCLDYALDSIILYVLVFIIGVSGLSVSYLLSVFRMYQFHFRYSGIYQKYVKSRMGEGGGCMLLKIYILLIHNC